MCGLRWASITWQRVRKSLEKAVQSFLVCVVGGGSRCHGRLSEQHVLEFFPGKTGVTGATVTKGRNNNSS